MKTTRRVLLATLLTALTTIHVGTFAQSKGASKAMATTLWPRETRTTISGVDTRVYDMKTAVSNGAFYYAHFDAVNGASSVPMSVLTAQGSPNALTAAATGESYAFNSERVAADVTISSGITLSHYDRGFADLNPIHGTWRFVVSALTAGGGNVETVIGDLTEPAVASGETRDVLYTTTIPVPTPITVAAGQRIVVRIYLVATSGNTLASAGTSNLSGVTGRATMRIAGPAVNKGDVNLSFGETITFVSNATTLYPRRTTTAAIGNFFDLLPTGVTQTGQTGVVTTVASGTEIQWTRTAGGIALEWISPRFNQSWNFNTPDSTVPAATFKAVVRESANTVNVSVRLKLFRYRAGVETPMFQNDYTFEISPLSLTQISTTALGGSNSITPTPFLPDDRLIVRLYVIPAPSTTMAAGSATLNYDAATSGVGETSVTLYDLPVNPFKAETDPATPATVPDGLNMLGLGN